MKDCGENEFSEVDLASWQRQKHHHLHGAATFRLQKPELEAERSVLMAVKHFRRFPTTASGSRQIMVSEMNSSDVAWFVVIIILGLNASGATSTVFQSILPGDRLFASNSDVLVSPNGAFAFGFFSGNLSSQMYLGIWFAGIYIQIQKISCNSCIMVYECVILLLHDLHQSKSYSLEIGAFEMYFRWGSADQFECIINGSVGCQWQPTNQPSCLLRFPLQRNSETGR